jgi:Family of unknown function (DUF6931)
MGSDGATKTPGLTVRQLCDQAKLGEESKKLLTDQQTVRQFLDLLVEKELFRDAIRLVAFALPKRESVGWGCLCVRHILASQQGARLPDVQLAVEKWVSSPNEENRWAAKNVADKEEPRSLSGLLALGAFFAGGSMALPNVQPLPPPEHVTSEIVAGAVTLSGVISEPEKAAEKYRVFMQKGLALMARVQQSAK